MAKAALINLIARNYIDGEKPIMPGQSFQATKKEADRLCDGRFPAAKRAEPVEKKVVIPTGTGQGVDKSRNTLVAAWKKKTSDQKNEAWATMVETDKTILIDAGEGPKAE